MSIKVALVSKATATVAGFLTKKELFQWKWLHRQSYFCQKAHDSDSGLSYHGYSWQHNTKRINSSFVVWSKLAMVWKAIVIVAGLFEKKTFLIWKIKLAKFFLFCQKARNIDSGLSYYGQLWQHNTNWINSICVVSSQLAMVWKAIVIVAGFLAKRLPM